MSNGELRHAVNQELVPDAQSHHERKPTSRFTTISMLVALTAVVTALAASAATGATGTVVTWRNTPIGNAITTSSGRTLYLFRADHGTTSACYGQCATYWPPLLTTGKPVAAGRVKVSPARDDQAEGREASGHLQGPPALHVPPGHEARPDDRRGLDGLRRLVVRPRAVRRHDRSGLIPRVVKAANTLGADVLGSDPHEPRGQRVIFISGDDGDAKGKVGALFEDAGFFPVDLGGLTDGGEMQQIHHPLAGLNLIRLR